MARTDDWDNDAQADDDQEYDDDAPIVLGTRAPREELNLGPDEHDLDLLDGSWEERYYSGQERTRNWGAIMLALGLLVVAGLIISMTGAWFR